MVALHPSTGGHASLSVEMLRIFSVLVSDGPSLRIRVLGSCFAPRSPRVCRAGSVVPLRYMIWTAVVIRRGCAGKDPSSAVSLDMHGVDPKY
jgi:hypothetical protein